MPLSASAPLVLGSASPRRHDILASLEIPFQVVSGAIDERAKPGEEPHEYLDRIVSAKLADVAGRILESARVFSGLVVADTIVVRDGQILGKPSDRSNAAELVSRLVGRAHTVMTRYAIGVPPAVGRAAVARTVESIVTMRRASPAEVRAYADTGEGLDKAGAYAAQGIGAFLISRIDGSFANVVGLPACELVEDLLALGLLSEFPLRGA
jgi:nucleoside triphosphate pyrophosphatase